MFTVASMGFDPLSDGFGLAVAFSFFCVFPYIEGCCLLRPPEPRQAWHERGSAGHGYFHVVFT